MNNAITIKNLHVNVGGFCLKNISLDIPQGTVVGFVGRNGTGKTTLIKTLSDLYVPSEGQILYNGLEMKGNEEQVKQMLGVVFDSLIYLPNLKPEKIVKMTAPFFPDFNREKWEQLMEKMRLPKKKALGTYSKGMQMKFMLAMTLARNPQILLLDEPTAGLDPAARRELLELIQEYMQDETHTVFFSTHITSDLDRIADYIAMIDNGELLFMEEKESLLEQYGLVQVAKDAMTDTIRDKLCGVKENAFGYIGLTTEKKALDDLPHVAVTRPTIEDILVYLTAGEEK